MIQGGSDGVTQVTHKIIIIKTRQITVRSNPIILMLLLLVVTTPTQLVDIVVVVLIVVIVNIVFSCDQ